VCEPFGLAVDQSDNLYIVTAAGDGTFVRRVMDSSNLIYTVLGAPPSAQAVALDQAGDLLVTSDIPDVVMLSPSSPGAAITGQEPVQLFLGYGQIWCTNARPEALRLQVQTNPHSPSEFRVNGAVSNFDEFGKAFGCKANQPMLRANACRVW